MKIEERLKRIEERLSAELSHDDYKKWRISDIAKLRLDAKFLMSYLKEKQTPKPIIHRYIESHKMTVAECPTCEWLFSFDEEVKYCKRCGQALSGTDGKQSK